MKIRQIDKNAGGFSLIEVCIALIIIGILMVPILNVLTNMNYKRKITRTSENIQLTQAALDKYLAKNGRYPRPADPSIDSTALGVGKEAASFAAISTVCTATTTTFCRTTSGSWDTVADTDVAADPVFIGSIPYNTLGLPARAAMDGYGSKLKYAVSAYLTNPPTLPPYPPAGPQFYNNAWGAIEVLRGDGTSMMLATSKAHYVLASPGRDLKAAFTLSGVMPTACGVSAAVSGQDFENCDNDAVFNTNFTAGVEPAVMINTPPGPLHFDDSITYTNSSRTGIWTPVPGQSSAENTNNLNIKIGSNCTGFPSTCAGTYPAAKIDVVGSVKANKIMTDRFCHWLPSGCVAPPVSGTPTQPPSDPTNGSIGLSPSIIGYPTPTTPTGAVDDGAGTGTRKSRGGGILCPDSMAMVGIYQGEERCAQTIKFNPGTTIGTCASEGFPPGTYPYGLGPTGKVICRAP